MDVKAKNLEGDVKRNFCANIWPQCDGPFGFVF